MDENLKQRLVGAAVVVVLAVVFIPVLLDGPPRPGNQTRALALPGQDATTVKQVTIDLGNPGEKAIPQPDPMVPDNKAPAMQAPVTALGDGTGKAELPAPKPDPQVKSETGATGAVQTQMAEWAVQVGSFSSQSNAERLASQLKGQGFKAFVSRYRDGGRTLYRVRVGPVKTRADADTLAEQLRDGGQQVKVVPNT